MRTLLCCSLGASAVACSPVILECFPEDQCQCVLDSDCTLSVCGPTVEDQPPHWSLERSCTGEGWPVTPATLTAQSCTRKGGVYSDYYLTEDCSDPHHVLPACRLGTCVAVIDPSQ